jgi:ATP-binding cassette subfamily F protein uup
VPQEKRPPSSAERSPSSTERDSREATDAKTARKLSFKEKHLLDTLPDIIAKLESEVQNLSGKLADNGFFARDRAGFDAVTLRLAHAQSALDEAETQWLELEERRAWVEAKS